jgi:hypothetical protein
MTPSTPPAWQGRSIVGMLALALVIVAMIVGISLRPAFSDDNERRDRQHERDQRGHPPARRAHQPPRREPQYQPYGYYAPPPVIYAPPPVVYAPPPSPGISLFFDLPFRHR